jgi:hypothetical protein
MEATPTSLEDRLRNDHQRTGELLAELELAEPETDADTPITLVRLLEAHLRATEVVLFPELEALSDEPLALDQSRHEHETLREHLAVMQRVRPDTTEFAGAVAGLRLELGQHAEAEEQLAVRLTGVRSPEQQQEIFVDYETARASVLLGDPVVPLDDISRPVVEGASPGASDEADRET